MKKYEKPMLMKLELAGNEQLCGSCANNGSMLLKDDLGFAGQILDMAGGDPNGNGTPDRSDFNVLFGLKESCSREVVMYCKFTGDVTVAWS